MVKKTLIILLLLCGTAYAETYRLDKELPLERRQMLDRLLDDKVIGISTTDKEIIVETSEPLTDQEMKSYAKAIESGTLEKTKQEKANDFLKNVDLSDSKNLDSATLKKTLRAILILQGKNVDAP